MINCEVCQRHTAPSWINGQVYCSVCGTAAKATPAPPRRVALDIAPRSHGRVTRSADPADKPQVAPVTSHEHHATLPAPAATNLHQRVKPAVLDLRQTTTPARPTVEPPQDRVPAAAPHSTAHERHQVHLTHKLERAKQVDRSPHIRGWRDDEPTAAVPSAPKPPAPAPVAAAKTATPAPTRPAGPSLPHQAASQHTALTEIKPAHIPDPVPATGHSSVATWRPHLKLRPQHGRAAATITAIALMAGYIWLHNYPKLALQSANNKAGINATLPGYLPSSYTLGTTDTSPGLITLNFTSPSASEALKIAQHRTTWDSSSLLDNFVAKATDDYATVQGQGLTIYLYNNNHATWVNRGIWYSIEGASHLSREQILKIAYSL